MKAFLSLLVLAVLIVGPTPAGSTAQSSAEWRDELADHMIGTWKMEGKIVGRDAHHEVEAAWVLNHQFVRIHEKTEDAALASEKRYEAIWFLGYDPVSERYVVHLLDVFGRGSRKRWDTARATVTQSTSTLNTPTARFTRPISGLRKKIPGNG